MLVLTLVVAASRASITFSSDVNNYDFILTLFKKAECSNRGPESLLDNVTLSEVPKSLWVVTNILHSMMVGAFILKKL